MHYWRAQLELEKPCVSFVLHWLGGGVWEASPAVGVKEVAVTWEANFLMDHYRSLNLRIYPQ